MSPDSPSASESLAWHCFRIEILPLLGGIKFEIAEVLPSRKPRCISAFLRARVVVRSLLPSGDNGPRAARAGRRSSVQKAVLSTSMPEKEVP
jgi:hypothetical protein